MTFVTDNLAVYYDAAAQPNQITNHSGTSAGSGANNGTGGWDAAGATLSNPNLPGQNVPGAYVYGGGAAGGQAITVKLSSSTYTVRSPAVAVRPGEFLSWAVNVGDDPSTHAGTNYSWNLRVEFYDAGGAVLSQGPFSGLQRSDTTFQLLPVGAGGLAVPAGAATARILIRTTSVVINPAAVFYVARAVMLTDPVAANVAARPVQTETQWAEITGELVSCRIVRGGDIKGASDDIDTGTVTLTFLGPNVDPATNKTLRRGRALEVVSDAGRDPISAPLLFRGLVGNVDADYDDNYGIGPVRVTVTGTDGVGALRGIDVPAIQQGGGTLAGKASDLWTAAALDNARGFILAGALTPSASPAVIGRDDGASAWDQLLAIRNSFVGGKVAVNRQGQLWWGTAAPAGQPAKSYTFSGDAGAVQSFTGLDLTYGTASVVNSLSVVKRNDGEPGGEKTYGPYRNEASIAQWGPVSASLDVVDGTPVTIATALLKRLSAATALPRALTFKITSRLEACRLIDVYDTARVILTRRNLDVSMFVVGVEHAITATDWTVTIRLRPLDVAAVDTISYPTGGANTGPADYIPKIGGPLGSRYRGATFSLPNAAWTTVPHDQAVTQDQVTYDGAGGQKVGPGGRYLVTAGVEFVSNATGQRGLRVVDATGAALATAYAPAYAGQHGVTLSKVMRLSAGAVVSCQAYQNSSAALTLAGAAGVRSTFLDVTYLGE